MSFLITPSLINMTVLIYTNRDDLHASAAMWLFEGLGIDVYAIYTNEYPSTSQSSIRINGDKFLISYDKADFTSIDSIWNRRMNLPDVTHACLEDRPFVENEATAYLRAFHDLIRTDVFEVNSRKFSRNAALKPIQLMAAKKVGLKIPDTLISNSQKDIYTFYLEHNKKVIYKPLQPHNWSRDDGLVLANVITSSVPEAVISNSTLLEMSPGIFQPELQRSHEFRITIMGDSVFSAKLQNHHSNGPDWRGRNLIVSDGTKAVPPKVLEKCRELMHELGLVFGCIDIVVAKGYSEPVFLEINEMGQWLYVERAVPHFQMLRTFCTMLAERSTAINSLLGRSEYLSFKEFTKSSAYKLFWEEFTKRSRLPSRFSTIEKWRCSKA